MKGIRVKTDPSTKINFRLFLYKFFLLFYTSLGRFTLPGSLGFLPTRIVLTLTHHGDKLPEDPLGVPFRNGNGRRLPGRRRSEVPCCSVTGPKVDEEGDSRNVMQGGARRAEHGDGPSTKNAT